MDRQVNITYKRSKLNSNPRAAKLRETGYFYRAMHLAAQIKYDLEKLATDEQLSLSEIKPTLISSDTLWFLADTYLDAYNALQKENLIKSGNIYKIQPTLN